jgi:HK97 family phage portal protein
MIRLLRAAMRGVKAELASGESGWVGLTTGQAINLYGRTSSSGQAVSQETIMQLSAVWSCVTRTSSLIGSLPGALYERQPDGGRKRLDNDLSRILSLQPNKTQTALEFWESASAHAIMQGNSYAEKLRIGKRLVGLRPLFNVSPKQQADGSYRYQISDAGQRRELGPDDVFHLRGFGGGDGMGLSAVRYGVQSFGSALSADEAAGSVFSNGLMAASIIESSQTLDSTQREQLQSMLKEFVGSKKAGKVLTLEAGLKHKQVTMNPEDAQLLETRRFQVEDICRWFGVPPIIIGHAAEGQTMWGSGVEAIMLAWLTMGINPLLRRIEARIERDLIPIEMRGRWYWEWNREAMLQMDSKSKSDFLSKMVTSGIMTSDESREKLNLERRGGAADELRAQTALAPLEQLMLKGSDQ